MRHMGTVIPAQIDPVTGCAEIHQVEIPAIPVADWRSLVANLVGRPVTEEEKLFIDRAERHNWTARATADSVVEGRI